MLAFLNAFAPHKYVLFRRLFVIGPHVYSPSVTDLSTLENIAKLRGNIGHEFVLFIQVGCTGIIPCIYFPLSPHACRT
jgi:hypothetical protein